MTNFLNIINSNVEYAVKATENSSRGKFFLVVEGDRIISFNKTKRGAEGYIKKNTFSYYDDYTQDMRSMGKDYQIIELCALDIVDYFNTKEIWFETIFSKWRIGQNNNYTLIQAQEMECSQEVINFIKLVLSHVDKNSFPSKELVGLAEVEEVEEIQLTADDEIIEEVVSNEKREIEYYRYKYNTRAYISDNYFIMKLDGCYRIFENGTCKEVHSLKTTEKLEDAKIYVTYLENKI